MISSTIFCVDELPNVQRFPHMILNSIFCMDEFPNVPKYAYDDCLTKLTVFGVVRDKWCRWKISRQHLVGVSAARGEGQLVHTFPKDNYKPDIWCRLVPFIWAGVVGVGGDGAQVPLRWSQAQYFSWMSSLFSRNSPHTILNTLFCDDDFHNIPTKCLWRKESYWAVPTFYFWYGSIDKSNFVIGWMVGVWVGGILGKRNQEPHTGFSYFR